MRARCVTVSRGWTDGMGGKKGLGKMRGPQESFPWGRIGRGRAGRGGTPLGAELRAGNNAAEVEEPIPVGGSSSEAQEGGVVVRGEVGEVLMKGIGEQRPGMAGIDDNSSSARAMA